MFVIKISRRKLIYSLAADTLKCRLYAFKAERRMTRSRSRKTNSEDTARIFKDRKRTNLFKTAEQGLIIKLVKIVPDYITSNHLTLIGGIGSLMVFIAFVLAAFVHPLLLLLALPGLAINWFGDSLDGRLAYFRNTPRKWYGFALDVMMDWFSTISIGLGYFIYAAKGFEVLGFLFAALYGWAILIAQLRYKITGSYSIDSGLAGPAELRILLALIFITEVLLPGSITYLAVLISITLFIINVQDTLKLLKAGDERDNEEKRLIH